MIKPITPKQALRFGSEIAGTVQDSGLDGEALQNLIQNRREMNDFCRNVVSALERELSRSVETTGNWLDELVEQETNRLVGFSGQAVGADIDCFRATLNRFGEERVETWRRLKLELHIIPRINLDGMGLSSWYCEQVAAGNILRLGADGQLVTVKTVGLDGIVALVDTREKPPYENGGQMFAEDSEFLGPIIKSLRRSSAIEDYRLQTSRFNVSAREWQNQIRQALSERPEFEGVNWRLETYPEFWHLGQTLRHGDGNTNTWIWFEGNFKDASHRLHGGDSDSGGLADVYYYFGASNHWSYRAVRPLGVLATLPLGP